MHRINTHAACQHACMHARAEQDAHAPKGGREGQQLCLASGDTFYGTRLCLPAGSALCVSQFNRRTALALLTTSSSGSLLAFRSFTRSPNISTPGALALRLCHSPVAGLAKCVRRYGVQAAWPTILTTACAGSSHQASDAALHPCACSSGSLKTLNPESQTPKPYAPSVRAAQEAPKP